MAVEKKARRDCYAIVKRSTKRQNFGSTAAKSESGLRSVTALITSE
jgi:hypothetical protein